MTFQSRWKALPPFQLDDAAEAEVAGEVAHAPGHDGDLGVREAAEGGFVEMVEVRVGEEDEVNAREVLDFQAGAFDAFEEEEPVGEVGVDEDVEVGELDEEGGVADPGDGDLARGQFGEDGGLVLAGAAGEQGFPDQFLEKGARVEMSGGGKVLEGLGQPLGGGGGTLFRRLRHSPLIMILITRLE